VDGPNDAAQVVRIRGGQCVEVHARSPIAREDAVENDDVVVDVQIEASAEALDERDGAAFSAVDSDALGALAVVSEHFLVGMDGRAVFARAPLTPAAPASVRDRAAPP
jgi:hypothetical protein